MKKIFCFVMLLIFTTNSFCQLLNPQPSITREAYLLKSKNQKAGARVLLVGGTALIGIGVLIVANSSLDNAMTGVVVAGIGIVSAIGSIPVFIASAKNKRRAIAASASLKIENIPGYSMYNKFLPGLSIKFRLYP